MLLVPYNIVSFYFFAAHKPGDGVLVESRVCHRNTMARVRDLDPAGSFLGNRLGNKQAVLAFRNLHVLKLNVVIT